MEKKHDSTDEVYSLKGTLFSSIMVAAFIGLLFVGIFWLYMSRV